LVGSKIRVLVAIGDWDGSWDPDGVGNTMRDQSWKCAEMMCGDLGKDEET
jgi:hypothetical protein